MDSPQPTRSSIPSIPLPPVGLPPRQHHRLRWTLLTVSAAVLIVLLTGGWLLYRAIAVVNTKKLDGSNSRLSFIQQLTHLVTSGSQTLQGEDQDRVNILILGIGGPGHDGPYLTDTMIVASVQPSTGQVALLSIPRDLVVDIPGYDFRKINNVLSFGRDQQYPGGGEALTVKVVSDLLDVPIQYYARVDFTAFKDIVNRVGGVDVTINRAFSDFSYPDESHGYQTVRFAAGPQHMSGDTALKFSRSRHGTNGEGSDFARSARQQKLLVGLKEKLLSFGTLANPKRISDILGTIGQHSQTNMEVWEMVRLAKIAEKVNGDTIVNKVLDDSQNGLLKPATGQNGAFILVPVSRSYADIQFLAQNIFLIGRAEREGATVAVVNATSLTGLADNASRSLAGFGLTMSKSVTIRGASAGQTVILDNANGHFPATAELLSRYKRAHGSISLAEWQQQTGDTSLSKVLQPALAEGNVNLAASAPPDLVLILGQDQPKTVVSTLPVFSAPRSVITTAKPATSKKTASLPHS